MGADAVRHDLNGRLALFADCHEVLQLGAHDGRPADDPADGAFVQDGPELGPVLLGEYLLAGHADLNPAFGLLGIEFERAATYQGAGVVLGLEQAGNDGELEGLDGSGFLFQPDEELVTAGQDVTVGVPPAALAGVLGELDKRLPLHAVAHAVDVEHDPHVVGMRAGTAGLDAEDLGVMPVQALGNVLLGEVSGFAEALELGNELTTANGRAVTRGHGASLHKELHPAIMRTCYMQPCIFMTCRWHATRSMPARDGCAGPDALTGGGARCPAMIR